MTFIQTEEFQFLLHSLHCFQSFLVHLLHLCPLSDSAVLVLFAPTLCEMFRSKSHLEIKVSITHVACSFNLEFMAVAH